MSVTIIILACKLKNTDKHRKSLFVFSLFMDSLSLLLLERSGKNEIGTIWTCVRRARLLYTSSLYLILRIKKKYFHKEKNKAKNSPDCYIVTLLLCVHEVVTPFYIVTYYIK